MLESVLVSMWNHIKDFFLKAAESPVAGDPGYNKDLEAFKEVELLYAAYAQASTFDKKAADAFLKRTEEILTQYPGSFTENLITIVCGRMEEIEDSKEAACKSPATGQPYNLW